MKGGNMAIVYFCKSCGRVIEQHTDIPKYPAPKKCSRCKGKEFTRKGEQDLEETNT